jgi:hypothetical protein
MLQERLEALLRREPQGGRNQRSSGVSGDLPVHGRILYGDPNGVDPIRLFDDF